MNTAKKTLTEWVGLKKTSKRGRPRGSKNKKRGPSVKISISSAMPEENKGTEGLYTSGSEESFKTIKEMQIESMYKGAGVSIKYPDRYIAELSFEELNEEMLRRSQLRQQVENKEYNTTIEIETDKPIAIGWLADIHSAGDDVDYERLKWEADEIKLNPYMRVILGGDLADSFCWNPAQYGDVANLNEQNLYLHKLIEYMGYEKVLAGVVGNHECLDEETEVCTKDGWKKYTELTNDDYLLTVDDKRVSSWERPSKIIIQDFNGELNSFKSKNIDMLVTDDHKVALIGRRNKKIKRIKAKDIARTKPFDHDEFIMAGENNNKEYKLKDCWIKLVAWIITDGWLTKTSCGISQRIKKAHLPREVLQNCGASYSERSRKRETSSIMGKILRSISPSIDFIIYAETRKKIEKLLPKGKYQLPKWVWKLSKRQFDVFLGSLLDADGSRKTETSGCFYQKNKQLIDDLQTLCSMNGYRTSIYQYYGDQYRLNICNRPTLRATNTKISKESYKGIVWDVTVPNHVFLVRRNGKAYFTGNSWARRTGLDMYNDLRKNIPIFDGVGTIELVINGISYTGAVMHKAKGNSYFNPNHGQKRFSMENEGYDFVLSAHNHTGAEQSQMKNTAKGMRKVVFLSGKTFKRGDDFLGGEGNPRLSGDGIGTNWILFNHKQKMMIPLSSTAEVIEIMGGIN